MCTFKWAFLALAVLAGVVGFGHTVAYQTLWQTACGLFVIVSIAGFASESREQCGTEC